jgi:thiamine-monophosphate kinase
LLIDAARMGHASGLGVAIDLDCLPLSSGFVSALGGLRQARLRAATCGDDYELLFAASPATAPQILRVAERTGLPLSRIGRFEVGAGLRLADAQGPVPLPERLGYEHRRA